jgi:hypothetical protein
LLKEEELSMTYVKVMESFSSFSNAVWTSHPPSALEPTIPKLKKKAFHWHNIYLSNLSSSIEISIK